MHYIKTFFCSAVLFFAISTLAFSQDTRERNYMYEILKPNHAQKPDVKGFVQARVDESLNRGLTLARIQEGGATHISWRLLKTDEEDVAFNVYRSVNGKETKLNKKPITETTDFLDTQIDADNALYWVEAIQGRGRSLSEKKSLPRNIGGEANYHSIKLKDSSVTAGRVAVADLNGDGRYDYIIRHPNSNVDPGVPTPDDGTTYKIEAYL